METLYSQTLHWMDQQLTVLFRLVPPPTLVRHGDEVAFRFVEKSALQAIIQKLARVTSGLRAASHLLQAGFLQEQAALCRMVDEFEEDITFLALASPKSPVPDLLQRYLDAFFAEETAGTTFRSGQRVRGRNLVGRRDIINFIARQSPGIADPFNATIATLAVGHTFSGFVHGASVQIMEMYDPASRSFITKPRSRMPFADDHEQDIWNYYYRGVLAFGFAAWAIGDENSMKEAREYQLQFEQTSGDRKDF